MSTIEVYISMPHIFDNIEKQLLATLREILERADCIINYDTKYRMGLDDQERTE